MTVNFAESRECGNDRLTVAAFPEVSRLLIPTASVATPRIQDQIVPSSPDDSTKNSARQLLGGVVAPKWRTSRIRARVGWR